MAEDPVRKRTRRGAKRIERQRRKALTTRTPRKTTEAQRPPAQTPHEQPGPGFPDLPPPPPIWPDDLEGGAGVREPRRPYPSMPTGALELDVPESQYLEMSAEPA